MKNGFEPKILGFLCNWCSYAGADLAGVSRFQYPPNLRVIRVMCSARVDPIIILEAFIQGIDGVLVLGCHLGDCHYISGNYYTQKRMRTLQKFLQIAGINEERLCLDWVSAAEGERFASLVTKFTEQIKNLGPLGKAENLENDKMKQRLLALQQAGSDGEVRWLVNKELSLVEEGNVYQEKVSQEEFDILMDEIIAAKYTQKRILILLKDSPLSVKDVSGILGLSSPKVLRQVVALEQEGLISMVDMRGNSPLYRKNREQGE